MNFASSSIPSTAHGSSQRLHTDFGAHRIRTGRPNCVHPYRRELGNYLEPPSFAAGLAATHPCNRVTLKVIGTAEARPLARYFSFVRLQGSHRVAFFRKHSTVYLFPLRFAQVLRPPPPILAESSRPPFSAAHFLGRGFGIVPSSGSPGKQSGTHRARFASSALTVPPWDSSGALPKSSPSPWQPSLLRFPFAFGNPIESI